MLLIKIGSGNELRHWPAGQPFAWLFACSPAPCWLVPSHSFPNCKGTIRRTACARDHSHQTVGTGTDSSKRETRGDAKATAPWQPHIYFRNNHVLFCPRDTLPTCFSVTVLKGFGDDFFFSMYFIWAASTSEFKEGFSSLLSVYYSYCSSQISFFCFPFGCCS